MTTTVTETVAETECDLAGVLTCQACGARTVTKKRWADLTPTVRARLARQGYARRGTVTLCHTCYVRDRRLNPPPSGPGRLTPMERVQQATRACDTCGRVLAPRGAWDALTPGERARLAATHAPATLSATCRACRDTARQRRATPPDPATLATAGACRECGVTLIRRSAWSPWPAHLKARWRGDGYAPEVPDKPGVCGTCARRTHLAAASERRWSTQPRSLLDPGSSAWMADAWCADTPTVLKAGLHPDWWTNHPTSSLPGAVVVEQQTQAAQACRAHCPVVAECLASQLALEMPGARVGVWGGTTPTDRTHITQDQEAS